MGLRRRDVVKMGVLGSAALLLPLERVARTKSAAADRIAASRLPKPYTLPFTTPPVLAPVRRAGGVDYYDIHQTVAEAEILPGLKTQIWGYNGITPGPTIVQQQGRKAVVRQCSELPAVHPTLRYAVETSTHLHGSASLPQYDGYASDVTRPDHYKDYQYPNFQNARTLWYHDHGVHNTQWNAYMGLAAMYLLHDPHERGLGLPSGRYDVPLIVRDAMFTSKGGLIFDDKGSSGIHGDVILVNGTPWPAMKVERRKYRFRVLNASISRSYEWSLSTGGPFTVIGTDGGLMPAPAVVTSMRHAPAERYEIVIDFSGYHVGQRIELRNKSPKNNVDYDTTSRIMAFDVVGEATDTTGNGPVPEVLNPGNEVMALQPSQSVKNRRLEFKRHSSEWTINKRTWADVVSSGYREVLANPGLGDVEIWELENKSGGWFHPVHIHLIDFKILDRNGKPPFAYERGPKDVVYVGENETVRVLCRFGPHVGRYMIHCHNLSHEDHDMMHQFVVGRDSPEFDPIEGDREKPMPGPDFPDSDELDRDEG